MGGCHLDDLDIVGQRSEPTECFVYTLHELRRKTRLHVLKFSLELLDRVSGLARDLVSLLTATLLSAHFFCDFVDVFSDFRQVRQQQIYILCQKSRNLLHDFCLQGLSYDANVLL